MFKKISKRLEIFFWKFCCGFRKGFSTKQGLLSMLAKWKSAVDNQKKIGVFLTDLSKAFDCLSHDSLIVKWKACRFSIDSLRLKQDYLSNRKQRTRINSPYNSWKEVLFGIPQGSILGPLLFNILLCDLFFIVDDIDFSSYADDNTVYPIENCNEDVIFKLQNSSKILF